MSHQCATATNPTTQRESPALGFPTPQIASQRDSGEWFECPTCAKRYETLADFDSRECER